MKGLIIALIIISCLFLTSVGIMVFQNFLYNKKITKMTIANDEFKEVFIKEITELKKIKPMTIKEITILSDEEKTQKIIELQNDKEKLIKLAEEAQLKLNLANEELKKRKNLLNEIDIFGMIGTDEELKLDLHAGAIYKRTLIATKNFEFNLGGGGAVKLEYSRNINNSLKQVTGGAGILQFGFKF